MLNLGQKFTTGHILQVAEYKNEEAPVQWQFGIRNWGMNLFLCFPPPPQHRTGPQIANVKVGGAGTGVCGGLFI